MTRRDYVLLAAALKAAREIAADAAEPSFTHRVCDINAREIANALAQANPRFDRARFLEAAGVKE